MKEISVWKKQILYLYLAAEAVLFVLILAGEARLPYAVYSKFMYAAILLNLLMALGAFAAAGRRGMTDPGGKRARDAFWPELILPGLAFTAAADLFLVLLDRSWVTGVILFCVVQTIYALSLLRTWKNWLIRVIVVIVLLAAFGKVGILDVNYGFSAYNIGMLCTNVVTAFYCYLKKPPYGQNELGKNEKTGDTKADMRAGLLLFATGLLLFAGCDTTLGIRNLTYGMDAFHTLYQICFWLVWICYMPSQVLITLAYRRRIW